MRERKISDELFLLTVLKTRFVTSWLIMYDGGMGVLIE